MKTVELFQIIHSDPMAPDAMTKLYAATEEKAREIYSDFHYQVETRPASYEGLAYAKVCRLTLAAADTADAMCNILNGLQGAKSLEVLDEIWTGGTRAAADPNQLTPWFGSRTDRAGIAGIQAYTRNLNAAIKRGEDVKPPLMEAA